MAGLRFDSSRKQRCYGWTVSSLSCQILLEIKPVSVDVHDQAFPSGCVKVFSLECLLACELSIQPKAQCRSVFRASECSELPSFATSQHEVHCLSHLFAIMIALKVSGSVVATDTQQSRAQELLT